MCKKSRNIPQSAVLTIYIDPFVLLLITSLMIIIGQSQISKSPVAANKLTNPINATTTIAQQKKAESRVQPIIFSKPAQPFQGKPTIIHSIIAESDFGPMYNKDGNIHYLEALLNWFEWDVASGFTPYNIGRFEVRNCGIGRSQVPTLLNALIGRHFVVPSLGNLNQESITFINFKQPTSSQETVFFPASPLVAKKTVSPLKTATARTLQKKEDRFQPIIYKTAQRYQVDPAIIKAIIMAESGFNPKAVSHKGARGLMQLMPRTAKYLGIEDSFNPEHNIEGGVRYFKRLLDRFGCDVELALAAYNAGSRNVRKYDGVPPFKATKIYIKKVLTYYKTYKNDLKDLQEGSYYMT